MAVSLPRAVARVLGDRPLEFLDAVTSQEVARLGPGEGALACLLDAGGRVLAELRVLPLQDGSVLLEGEPACRAALGDLARIAPLSACEVTHNSERWEVVAVRGPDAAAALAGVLPEREHGFVERDGALVVRVEWGLPGFDVIAPAGRLPAVDAPTIEPAAFEAARIAAGRPRYGVDVTSELLVNETPLIARAVSFTKGCYPGQESVARIQNLGRARRRLVGLAVDGEAPPPGAPVRFDGKDTGRITSAVASSAIALVRAEIPAGAEVDAGGRRALVRSLP